MRYGWSLKPDRWATVAKLSVHDHWKRAPFHKDSRDMVPDHPGVYAICASCKRMGGKLFPHLYNVIYVGQSESLRARFVSHSSRPKPEIGQALKVFRKLDYWYSPMPLSELNPVEESLIALLG